MNESNPSFDAIGVAGALSRNYASDQAGFVPYIATMLESALPEHVSVERQPVRFLSHEKRVSGIEVTLGDVKFSLKADPKHPVACTRTKSVRGIKLKTEDISMGEWLDGIAAAITEKAASSEKAYFALKNFLDSTR